MLEFERTTKALKGCLHVTGKKSHSGMKLTARWKAFCLQVDLIP